MSSPAEIDRAVIAALGSGEAPANMTELRRATGAPAKPLSEAVQRLRFQGKILFDRLELSPSMRGTLSRAGIEAEPEPIEARPLGAPEGAAAEAQSRAPEAAPSPSSDPTGPELHAEAQAYMARTGTSATALSTAISGHPTLLTQLRNSRRPTAATTEKVRAFMAEHPDGLPKRRAGRPPAPKFEPRDVKGVKPLASVQAARPKPEPVTVPSPPPSEPAPPAPAAEAPLAAAPPPPTPPPSLTPVERVATMLADEPNDLMLAIERRHKRAWWRIVLLSRQLGKRPGEALYDVLEAGLAELDPEPANEARAA